MTIESVDYSEELKKYTFIKDNTNIHKMTIRDELKLKGKDRLKLKFIQHFGTGEYKDFTRVGICTKVDEDGIDCFCGRADIRNLFRVKCRLNDEIVTVGICCIEKFKLDKLCRKCSIKMNRTPGDIC